MSVRRRHCSFNVGNNSFSFGSVYYRPLIAHTNANNYAPTIPNVRHSEQTRTWVYLCKQKFTLQRHYTCVFKKHVIFIWRAIFGMVFFSFWCRLYDKYNRVEKKLENQYPCRVLIGTCVTGLISASITFDEPRKMPPTVPYVIVITFCKNFKFT